MRRIRIFWLGHFAATVAGWYVLSAAAQGAVDSRSDPSIALVVFNGIIEILCFPVVLIAIRVYPSEIGNFSLAGFAWFVLATALNSTLVAVLFGAVMRRLLRPSQIDGE